MTIKENILTGDRPTGKLHLGHLAGSLLNRVKLQEIHNQTILIADMQGLTDNALNPQKISDNIITSRSWIWRRSSRRWMVIPSAPACSDSIAACTGSGYNVPLACLKVAIWSMLTPNCIVMLVLYLF